MMNVKRRFLASDISCSVSLEISITSCGVSLEISAFLVTLLQVLLMESKDSDQLSITTNLDASAAQLLPSFLHQLQTYFSSCTSKIEIIISVQKCQCPETTLINVELLEKV